MTMTTEKMTKGIGIDNIDVFMNMAWLYIVSVMLRRAARYPM